ncbi:TPA: hypothetical protein ACIPE5_002462 [Salmonella enterica subsp. diarizonae serovar 61:r:-]
MSDFVFPFQWRELHNAAEWLNTQKANGPKVTQDDFISWWQQGTIELCYFWGDEGLVVPDFCDAMSFIERPFYRVDPSDVPRISVKPYGTGEDYRLTRIPTGSEYDPYELAFDLTASGLVIPRAEMLKVWRMFNPLPVNPPAQNATVPKVHGNAERNAIWRERVLLAAGYVKIHFPKECKNSKGRETRAAWASALIDHWHLFGDDSDAPEHRTATEIIGDIYKLPANRKRAGKNAP